MIERTPLKWPSGWPRVRPENQKGQPQWKKSHSFYVKQLEDELKRMGAESFVLTLNDAGSRDPGVAVWFTRKRLEDFSWRETLEITAAYPTIDDISSAYRKLVAKYHTDNMSTGDLEVFHKITKARAAANDWVNRREGSKLDNAIGADAFREQKLNIAALAGSIRHIRGLERCGTSAIMEKTLEGFAQLVEGHDVAAGVGR